METFHHIRGVTFNSRANKLDDGIRSYEVHIDARPLQEMDAIASEGDIYVRIAEEREDCAIYVHMGDLQGWAEWDPRTLLKVNLAGIITYPIPCNDLGLTYAETEADFMLAAHRVNQDIPSLSQLIAMASDYQHPSMNRKRSAKEVVTSPPRQKRSRTNLKNDQGISDANKMDVDDSEMEKGSDKGREKGKGKEMARWKGNDEERGKGKGKGKGKRKRKGKAMELGEDEDERNHKGKAKVIETLPTKRVPEDVNMVQHDDIGSTSAAIETAPSESIDVDMACVDPGRKKGTATSNEPPDIEMGFPTEEPEANKMVDELVYKRLFPFPTASSD